MRLIDIIASRAQTSRNRFLDMNKLVKLDAVVLCYRSIVAATARVLVLGRDVEQAAVAAVHDRCVKSARS